MSAIIKTATILSGLAVTASAVSYAMQTQNNFAQNALAAAGYGATEPLNASSKSKL